MDWDEELDGNDFEEWLSVKCDLKETYTVEVPRRVVSVGQSGLTYSLICFCDASTKVYASAIYLHQVNTNGERKSDLIFAKSRLAPVKGMSIPRLELMALLIGVRSVDFVKTQLHLEIEQVMVVTDSQCALQWIITEKSLPVFIENRVKEIRCHSDFKFFHVNTKENPADIASRGCTLQQLRTNELWWYGPKWLTGPVEECPLMSYVHSDKSKTDTVSEHDSIVEESANLDFVQSANKNINKETVDENLELQTESPFHMDINRYSSWSKLIKTTAWYLRFIKRLRGQSVLVYQLQVKS